jgi:hypothetical protein
LSDFLLKDLSAHPITHTITIDNEVFWVVSAFVSKAAKCSLDGFLELRAHYLLSLLLNDPLAPVLTTSFIYGVTESHNRHGSRVTHIHADEHSQGRKMRGEFQLIKVSTELRVDLAQHVAGYREVHALAKVLIANTLRNDVVLIAERLVGLVVSLVA